MRRLRLISVAVTTVALLGACSGSGQPSPTASAATPESAFRALLAAINAGDAARTAALLSPGGQVFGDAITADNVDAMARRLSCTADIVSATTTGDTVRATVTITGTSSMASGPCPSIGLSEVLVATVRDGRIVSLELE